MKYNGAGMQTDSYDANFNSGAWPGDHKQITAYDTLELFPQTVQHSNTGSVAHGESYQYDDNLGEVTYATDQNDNTTEYDYDSSGRLTYQIGPVTPSNTHSKTTIDYTDPSTSSPTSTTITKTVLADPDPQQQSSQQLDGLARPIITTIANDATSETVYDALGRVLSVSNPHIGSSGTIGYTTFAYDALGRKILECNPDNGNGANTCVAGSSYKQWVYSGNTVTFYDERRNTWQRTTDALNRLTKVVEPNGAKTSYSYDALGNLLTVTQSGVAGVDTTPRTRSFAYDSLSRLLCASNPENSTASCPATASSSYTSGTTGYTYDANGNVVRRTDARGVVTAYTYDALNRLLSKTYGSAGSMSSCYQYDTASNGVGLLGAEWTQAGTCAASPPSGYQVLRVLGAYDVTGNVTTEQQCVLGFCTSAAPPSPPASTNCSSLTTAAGIAYCYDLAGNLTAYGNGLTSATFPANSILISQSYDSAGRLAAVGSSWNDVTHPAQLFSATGANAYTPANALSNWVLGGSLYTARAFDIRNRVCRQQSSVQSISGLQCQ
jgi:YD repeat-containing protein